jgi:hypothetical protein
MGAGMAAESPLLRLSRVDPSLKDIDLCIGPGTIARHRAGAEPGENGVGVFADIIVGPQIEGEAQRLRAK